MKERPDHKTIDAYIRSFPARVQPVLKRVRASIRAAAPDAEEAMSYRIPTFRIDGRPFIYLAGYERHIGIYPVLADMGPLEKDVAKYRSGRGSLRFPLDAPIPYPLVTKIAAALRKRPIRRTKPKPRPKYPMPASVREALIEEQLMDAYKVRPPYQRNDYLGWIAQAKQEKTKQKRLDQMLEDLRDGGIYMGMAWRPKKGG